MAQNRRDLRTLVLASAAFASLASLSFVATPVKFLAQEVPIAHLLAVGQVTFRASLAVECCLLLGLLLTTSARSRWLAYGAAMALAFQWLALMPPLDERTLARIAGNVLAPSSLHHWWILLDVARLGIYAIIMRKAWRMLFPSERRKGPNG